MELDNNNNEIMIRMSLKEIIEIYLNPEMNDDEHDNAFSIISTKISLINKRNGIMMIIDDDDSNSNNDNKLSSIFNKKQEDIQSNTIHIQDMIEHLQIPLTSDDDKYRHRATLLLAEIFHYNSNKNNNNNYNIDNEIMSSTVLHLFITFFCRRLADYPSILPSIHALIALISIIHQILILSLMIFMKFIILYLQNYKYNHWHNQLDKKFLIYYINY